MGGGAGVNSVLLIENLDLIISPKNVTNCWFLIVPLRILKQALVLVQKKLYKNEKDVLECQQLDSCMRFQACYRQPLMLIIFKIVQI